MIGKDESWIWAYNEKNELEDISTTGKWLYWASLGVMEEKFPRINDLVDQGIIYRAKYSHRENEEVDSFWHKDPVLCVIADDTSKERTLNELHKLGIKPVRWKYNSETKVDRAPGGKLYKKARIVLELKILLSEYQEFRSRK